MRQIVLDTETTGIDPAEGHRIIEIGCVELMERQPTGRHYHVYINPEREVEAEAISIHGITNEFLADKPLFASVADEFFEFIKGAGGCSSSHPKTRSKIKNSLFISDILDKLY